LPAESTGLRPPIALVSRLNDAEAQAWRDRLAALLPDERVLPFEALDQGQRRTVEIAIVANPDPAQMAALPGLKWIHSLWAGVERLVAELGPDAPPIIRLIDPELSRVMAEAVLAWTYYLHRDMPAYGRQQSQRVWRQLPYRRPGDLVVGVLGVGELGAAACARLSQAGFAVKGWSRTPKALAGVETFVGAAGLAAIVGASDIVVCLLPLTAETRGLIDARFLEGMKPGAALINFARGPIVVDADLRAALDRGALSHAVLDVFDIEPLPQSSPLWGHGAVTVLPHVAALSAPESAACIVAAAVLGYRATGCLPAAVDRTRGY